MESSVLAVESKRRAPKACSFLVILGWLVLAGSLVWAVALVLLCLTTDMLPSLGLRGGISVANQVADLIFMGLVPLIVAQFVRFLFGAVNGIPLLVRHGNKVLFLYAAVTSCLKLLCVAVLCFDGSLSRVKDAFAGVAATGMLLGPTILVCVGIGIAMPKVVAGIDEMKRLV